MICYKCPIATVFGLLIQSGTVAFFIDTACPSMQQMDAPQTNIQNFTLLIYNE